MLCLTEFLFRSPLISSAIGVTTQLEKQNKNKGERRQTNHINQKEGKYILTHFLKPIDELILQEIQDHEAHAANQRISIDDPNSQIQRIVKNREKCKQEDLGSFQ